MIHDKEKEITNKNKRSIDKRRNAKPKIYL